MKKKFIIIGTVTFLLLTPTFTIADNLQQQLSQYQKQYNYLDNQQKQQKQQKNDLTARVAGLQETVQTLNANITLSHKEIDNTQRDINDLADQQRLLAEQRQKAVDELSYILKTYYESGTNGYLEVIMGATNLSDFFERIDLISYIYKGYNRTQQKIADLDKSISEKKTISEKKKADLQTQVQTLQQNKATTQQSEEKLNILLSQLTVAEKATLKSKSQAQANIDYVQQLIYQEQIDAENAKNHPVASSGGTSITQPVKLKGTVVELISYAENYTGVPYLWGGTTPSGFDCSGFVQYVFKHFSIQLPRVSQDQYNVGIPVSKDNLQPGDIVFFSTYAPGASHEGIYIGNDMMIDAESRGVLVTRLFGSSYWGPRYIGARRVIQN